MGYTLFNFGKAALSEQTFDLFEELLGILGESDADIDNQFTKTARKKDDAAVFLAYLHNRITQDGDYKIDGNFANESVKPFFTAVKNRNLPAAVKAFEHYLENEEIDVDAEEVAKPLVKIFFRYLQDFRNR